MNWIARGFNQSQIVTSGGYFEVTKPNGVTWEIFRDIRKRAGRYILKGKVVFITLERASQDSEIVIEIIGSARYENASEVYYKKIEFLDATGSGIDINIPDIDIHYGLNYQITITLSGQAMMIGFQDVNLTRINRQFTSAQGDNSDFSRLGRKEVNNSFRQTIIEFNRGITPEIKDDLFFYPQSKRWFGDQNLNHELPDGGYIHPETRYFSSERIGQPRRGEVNHIFMRSQPSESYNFSVRNEKRPIFIRSGVINDLGLLSLGGNWEISAFDNGTRNLNVSIRQSKNLRGSSANMSNQDIQIPIFKDANFNTRIGEVIIRLNYTLQ